MRRILNRLGIDIRRGETTVAFLLFLCFFLIITFQYTTKPVRQSEFIDNLGASKLPYVYLLVALCSYPLLRIYGRLADRVRRHTLIAATCVVVVLSFVLFWWLFQDPWPWVPVVFYVWVTIVFVMMVSQFWSYANHVFDARQAKRMFGFVGAGGLLGSVAGGQVARLATELIGTRYALLIAAAIMGLIIVLINGIHRLAPADEAEMGAAGLAKLEEARGGFELLRQSKLLQLIGVVMVLTVMVAQIVDLQFNWAVEQSTPEGDARTAFYGNFYSVMGIAAFIFQLMFTSRIHRTLGVGFGLRVLPVSMALGTGMLFLTAATMPAALIVAAVVLKVSENGVRYSLDQATRELLFLPVPSHLRVKAKAFIDVFLQRGAKGLAALILLPVAVGLMTALEAGWITLALIAVWLFVTAAAYREYVATFRQGLERGTVDAEAPVNVSDVTTLELLVQSLGSADPRQVLHGLEILASHDKGHLVPPMLLHHDDAEVRLQTLRILADARRRDAVGLIERRLGDDNPDVRAEAIRVLAELRGQNVSSLMLPRLSDADPGVRAAAVACIANYGGEEMTEQAHAALSDMLLDSDRRARAEAAKAMGAIREPSFRTELLHLLYDTEPLVAREALAAVRKRVSRDGTSKEYAPTLVSLLASRHVRHEARDALVVLGTEVLSVLSHFMNDPEESVWVRRALPKTIANIGTREARDSLLGALGKPRDAFLRRKLIESLNAFRDDMADPAVATRIGREIRSESRRYLETVADLSALGIGQVARFESPRFHWTDDLRDPSLLERLLCERMDDHVRNIFGLLSLIYPPADIWAAHRGLTGDHARMRGHALEYLDNTLTGELKSSVFAAIDDVSLDQKLVRGRKMFDLPARSGVDTLRVVIETHAEDDPGASDLAVAGLYSVHIGRVKELYDVVGALAANSPDRLVRETAGWVAHRIE